MRRVAVLRVLASRVLASRVLASRVQASRVLALMVLVSLLLVSGVVGCADGAFNWTALFPSDSGSTIDDTAFVDRMSSSVAYTDSIAEVAYFDGMRRLRVRGYGLVAGLGDQGSEQCPPHINKRLIQELYKRPEFTRRSNIDVTPQQLISEKDTAVVSVEGEIPAAAIAGGRFDLMVRAVPGDQTLSLEGGWLYPCELTIYRSIGGGAWIPGKKVAEASGPVFMNPFGRGEDAATRVNLREGIVIGGGTAGEDRRVRLILTVPSYQRATAIARRLNARFADREKPIADALSPTEIRVRVPRSFQHDPRRFLAVAQHVYLPRYSGFMPQRIQELAREFVQHDAPHEDIALAWEAAGRTALPTVQGFYTHAKSACSFYSARAGLYLGDEAAVEVIASHLANPKSKFRMQAIQALSGARLSFRAAGPIRDALDDDDIRIRIAAYHGLLDRDDPSIVSIPVGDNGFMLDVVPSRGENLVYATRHEYRRIALIGDHISARPPIFYTLPNNALTVDAEPNDEYLTLIRKSKFLGVSSPRIKSDLRLQKLIALLGSEPPRASNAIISGLGMGYSDIILLMSELCKTGGINASFMLEKPDQTFLPSLLSKPGRPETSDL